jgi:hypothetical protein
MWRILPHFVDQIPVDQFVPLPLEHTRFTQPFHLGTRKPFTARHIRQSRTRHTVDR